MFTCSFTYYARGSEMQQKYLMPLISIVYSLLPAGLVLSEPSSNKTSEIYQREFVTSVLRYDVKVRHDENGDLLIFSNDTAIRFLLFSDLQNLSILIEPGNGYDIECDRESEIGSGFILSTEARDFEETLTLKCGDSVLIRKRG